MAITPNEKPLGRMCAYVLLFVSVCVSVCVSVSVLDLVSTRMLLHITRCLHIVVFFGLFALSFVCMSVCMQMCVYVCL